MILLQIHVNDIDTRLTVKGISKNLAKAAGDGVFKIARKVANETRKEVIRQKLVWSTKLRDSIKAKKLSKLRSKVTIRREGIALDSMRPHFVSLRKGRKITKWAREKGIKGGAIYVRPHPFIDAGIIRGVKRQKQIMDREIKRLIQRKGR